MGSRDKDQTTPHQPLLSSLVVRPTGSGGDGGGAGAGAGSDYEPGEVRRDPPPYTRSDRYPSDRRGFRTYAGSVSPVRRGDVDNHHRPGFNHSGSAPRIHGFGSERDVGRYRERSPPNGRGSNGGRFTGRPYDGPGRVPGAFGAEGLARNNPNVRPREGDWICQDPLCKNLNFARREYCNKCNRFRYAPSRSPRRGYPGPPPPRRFPGPPLDHSLGRITNRSPPRGWATDNHRELGPPGPSRHEGRFPSPPLRRVGPGFPADDYRSRYKLDRPLQADWGHRDRGRNFYDDRRGYERRPPSPPLPLGLPSRGQWSRDFRERSRSPVRGAAPPKDYQRDVYMGRGRDHLHVARREAF